MKRLPCPYLNGEVELTEERRQHILAKHPDFLPEYFEQLAETLSNPDEVRSDRRFPQTRLFVRWFDSLKDGKYVVVAIVSDSTPHKRHWIATAYIARKVSQGEIEWHRN